MPYYVMLGFTEAFAELSSVTQQIVRNPFDCTNGCDLTAIYAIIIGAIVTIIVLGIQTQLAREQEKLRTSVTKTKLRSDALSLLNQMRMLQPIVYEKKKITPENRKLVSYVAKTISDLEETLEKLDGLINKDEKEKIYQMIARLKRRLKYGSSDFGKFPHRYEAMDFAESIRDVGRTLPVFP